ncbi:MAG: bifunctional riboflavin kinase/FAD synthetase [Firmicutes bacterium]|nr:bifunctional riboflavin kinase/FAD synthetase [Bacillota bacterium]
MIIFNSIEEVKKYRIEPSACALGSFDGIHKGHQKLIKRCIELAKENGLKSAVFTFSEHPINVMSGHIMVKNILKDEDKMRILSDMGVDYVFSFPFSDDIRTLSPRDYAEKLLKGVLNIRYAICGFNHSFGFKAAGKNNDLIAFGKEFGFETEVIPPVEVDGIIVSSTLIRACIEKGEMKLYKEYTGRPYIIYGTIIQGEHNGRKMGFPTVNLKLDISMALPANGVYTTYSYIDDIKYKSVTNVGNKPTVGDFAKNAETHIFEFQEDVYGKPLKVEFIRMQRPEFKFENMETLANQIEKDCKEAKEYHDLH